MHNPNNSCFTRTCDQWEGLLWLTRVILVPEKWFWYMIDQPWQNGKCIYKNSTQAPDLVLALNEHGQPV